MDKQIVSMSSEAVEAIREFLVKENTKAPIRIDIQSTGCCDASLGLGIDRTRASDLIQTVEGLEVLISPEIHQLVGKVNITHKCQEGESGFILTSEKPLNEWEGFGLCRIRTKPNG